jgi:hypothetical protein
MPEVSALIRKFNNVFFYIVSPPATLEAQRPQSEILFLLPLTPLAAGQGRRQKKIAQAL